MQNDAPLKMPDACASLGELREAIDTLDARLVALLAVRQAYIERAARLKTAREGGRASVTVARTLEMVTPNATTVASAEKVQPE